MDYTILPKSIKETMSKAGCPLSESQEMILAGSMAVMQQYIKTEGLEKTLQRFTGKPQLTE